MKRNEVWLMEVKRQGHKQYKLIYPDWYIDGGNAKLIAENWRKLNPKNKYRVRRYTAEKTK